MLLDGKIWIAKSEKDKVSILPKMANRHGLIAGATGTGKTVTLKVMAESFSDAGVPVFLADVKGDLAGMCKLYPVCFWDIFGVAGLPLRTTISEMGPTLLARLMDLNPTQSDILTIVFKIADDQGLLLLDTKDLRSMLSFVADNSKDYSARYGNIARQSVNSILRSLVALEQQGGGKFFGEPALDIHDWFSTDFNGKGMINILHSESLVNNPMMYSTFMLWMLSELFEIMPEVGDCDKPKMIFFFDEAHLLFKGVPKALLQKITQVVKLIRSKGVGVYFITQSPSDIPDEVLGQLGNKIQHGLHAYTPADQKAVRAVAQSFRVNPAFDTQEVLTQLGIGEALISVLQEDGSPSIVQRCKVLPPQSQMGPVDEQTRQSVIINSSLYSKYGTMIDRDSAYEFFQRKARQDAAEAEQQADIKAQAAADKDAARQAKTAQKEQNAADKARKRAVSNVAKSAASTIGREVGNEIGKNFGSFGKRLGGNVGASIGRGLLGTLFGK